MKQTLTLVTHVLCLKEKEYTYRRMVLAEFAL